MKTTHNIVLSFVALMLATAVTSSITFAQGNVNGTCVNTPYSAPCESSSPSHSSSSTSSSSGSYCHHGQVETSNGKCMPAGATECAGGGHCKAGSICTPQGGCILQGYMDCGNGYSCHPGSKCYRSGARGCMPLDATDCGDYYCDAGNKCASGRTCIPQDTTDCGDNYCYAGYKCGSGNVCMSQNATDCGDGNYCNAGMQCVSGGTCIPYQSTNNAGGSGDHTALDQANTSNNETRSGLSSKRLEYTKDKSNQVFDNPVNLQPSEINPAANLRNVGQSPAVRNLISHIPATVPFSDPVIKDNIDRFRSLESDRAVAQAEFAKAQKYIDNHTGNTAILEAYKTQMADKIRDIDRDQKTAQETIKRRVVNLGKKWIENPGNHQ